MCQLSCFHRTIYERLSEALVDEEQRQIYLSRAQEVEPNIQYCAYQIGQLQGLTDVKKLMELRNKAAAMPGTQEFLAAEIDVRPGNHFTVNSAVFA